MNSENARARRSVAGGHREESSAGEHCDARIVVERSSALQPPLAVDAPRAAELAGVSRALWWRLHAAGRVPAPVRIGPRTLWVVATLERWFALGCPDRAAFEARSGQERVR